MQNWGNLKIQSVLSEEFSCFLFSVGMERKLATKTERSKVSYSPVRQALEADIPRIMLSQRNSGEHILQKWPICLKAVFFIPAQTRSGEDLGKSSYHT